MNSYPQKPVVARPKNVSQGGGPLNRLLGLLLLLVCATTLATSAMAGVVLTADSRALVNESCTPANGQIDPGEIVTVSFAIKNTGDAALAGVKAQLKETGGVTFVQQGVQTLGDIAAGATKSVSFTFRAGISCGSTLVPTLDVGTTGAEDSFVHYQDLAFSGFQMGATVLTTYTFANSGAISIIPSGTAGNLNGKANPYPSAITVANVPNDTTTTGEHFLGVVVHVNNLTYPWSPDLNMVLVHGSQAVALMSAAGGNTVDTAPVSGVSLTFSDAASGQLPNSVPTPITTGTYKPSNFRPITTLPDLGLSFAAANTLGAFSGDPNVGTWQLFVQDPFTGLTGTIAGGWSLDIITTKIVCCGFGQTAPVVTRIANATINEDDHSTDTSNLVIADFNVSDLDSGPETLAVSATSADQTRVANSALSILAPDGNTSTHRQVKLAAPVANATGDVTITVTATDAQGHSGSQSFNLHINPVNDQPTISSILGQKVNIGTSTGPIPFTVGDVETPAASLVVSAHSSDQTLVPDINIVIPQGTGANKTVTVNPASGSTQGTVTITLTVDDLSGLANSTASTSFVVAFTATANSPTITPISNTSTPEDTPITIPFVVRSGVPGVSPDSLTLSKTSSDAAILPLTGITFAGTGTDRTVTLTPAANANGTVTVTLTVANGALTDSTQFTLTITPVNDQPTISVIPNQVINEDGNTGDIAVTVGDVEDPSGNSLHLSATGSDNTALVPLSAVTFGGSGNARTVRVTPAANQFGRAVVTVTVDDRSGAANATASRSFSVIVNAVNDAPTIEFPAEGGVVTFNEDEVASDLTDRKNRITLSGIRPGPVGISNEDSQAVTIAASSANSSVVSIVGIAQPTGAYPETATLTVQFGENKFTTGDNDVEITLTLTDNGGTAQGGVNTSTRKFKVHINPVNDQPAVASISNQIIGKGRSVSIPISVSDIETPKSELTMAACIGTLSLVTDANGNVTPSCAAAGDPQGIFPAGSILFDPSNSFLTIVPNGIPAGLDKTHPYTVTVSVAATDKGPVNTGSAPKQTSTPRTFTVTIADVQPPTAVLAPPASVSMDEDTVQSTTMTLTDNEDLTHLTFSISSDNTALIPNDSGILLGPITQGAPDSTGTITGTRPVIVQPSANQSGTANVTITATDTEGFQSATVLHVSVREINDPPTIGLLGDMADGAVSVLEDHATADTTRDSGKLEFDIGDVETPADQLVITKTSSNLTLVPLSNIVIAGTGTRRTLVVTPAANQNGTARITLSVTDGGGLSSSAFFDLTVVPVNDPPTINSVADVTVNEDSGQHSITLSGITAGPEAAETVPQTVHVVTPITLDRSDIITIDQQPSTITDGAATLKFTPIANKFGTTKVTVTVQDSGDTSNGGANSTSISFNIIVNSVNDLPVVGFTYNASATPQITDATKTVSVAAGANSTDVIPFYISDVETPNDQLRITATSGNPSIVPNTTANLQVGGSGTSNTRSILVTRAPDASGTVPITLTVTDADGGSSTATLTVTFAPGANPRVTLNPTTQTIHPGAYTDLILVAVSDAQSAADTLALSASIASTSNANLLGAAGTAVSSANLQFGGGGASRAMIILPNANQTGTAVVRVKVTDPDGNFSTADFTLIVLGEPPTITSVANQTVGVNKSTTPAAFTVNDKETFPGFLVVTKSSSDQTIISDANIFVLGSGSSRSVSVLAGNKGGSATITLTVTDTENQTASTSFVVTVNDNRNKPTISSVGSQSTTVNKPTGLINFVVGDVETPAGSLVVTGTSSNTNLVPNASILVLTSPSSPSTRSLLITPATDKTGATVITVTVTDGDGMTATTQFTLNVSVQAVPNDFNGDRAEDIILQDNSGFLAAWYMSGDDVLQGAYFTPNNVGDPAWKVVGDGDFTGDGKPDLLFQHTDGSLAVWALNGVTLTGSAFLNPSNAGATAWKAVAVGDFNKDGKPDILFKADDGTLALWYMDGVNLSSVAFLVPNHVGAGWNVVGAGDFNGDGSLDILFQHDDSTLGVWYMMNTNNLNLAGLLNPPSTGDVDWRAVGVIDLNGDGKPDILVQNRATGQIGIWYMNGPNLIFGKLLNPSNPGGTWKVVAP